jgi:hypothetical protein
MQLSSDKNTLKYGIQPSHIPYIYNVGISQKLERCPKVECVKETRPRVCSCQESNRKNGTPASATEPGGWTVEDMAALAAHHHRLLSSSSAAAPPARRRRRLSSLPFSPRPSSHGRLSSSTRASGGGGTSSAAAPPAAAATSASLSLEELRRGCTTWTWRGMRVNYLARGQGPPVLLVHGFGASVAHWRR